VRVTDFKRLRTPDLKEISNDVKYTIGRKKNKIIIVQAVYDH